jgi:hypothetical protein
VTELLHTPILAPTAPNPLHGIRVSEIVDEYHRRDLLELDDQRLVESAAAIIGVPRDEVLGDRYSYVLHAPLELLARAALLPYVAPNAREGARMRIVSLAAGYEASGPPAADPPAAHFDSLSDAAVTLVGAIDGGDLDDVDTAAAWLGARARPDQLGPLLADTVLDRLSAAGHANIYLALLTRTQPRGVAGQMLRHPVRELAKGSVRRIRVPCTYSVVDTRGTHALELLGTLTDQNSIGPPHSLFIAPLVEYAQERGVFERFVEDRVFVAPDRTSFELLRFAALAMLQGPDEHAPYGWTHCLTLALAPLQISGSCSDPGRAAFVAIAYLAAHWAGLGAGTVDYWFSPRAVEAGIDEALTDTPAVAAAAAWHTADPARTLTALATSASLAHDAHRVKYTLACLDAAAADPAQRRLYLAAAAHLNAWWRHHPDPSDPLDEEPCNSHPTS